MFFFCLLVPTFNPTITPSKSPSIDLCTLMIQIDICDNENDMNVGTINIPKLKVILLHLNYFFFFIYWNFSKPDI